MSFSRPRSSTSSARMWITIMIATFLPKVAIAADEHFPRFSFRLAGEAGILAMGDINRALRLFNHNESLEYVRKNNPSSAQVQGKIAPLNSLFLNWEPELRIDIGPRIGIGIAASGAIHRQNESSLAFIIFPGDGTTWPYHYYIRPEINAKVPLTVTFYYYWLRHSRLSLYAGGGIGLYQGNMSEEFNYEETNGYSGDVDWTKNNWKTQSKSSLGGHIGLGTELHLSRNLALVGEIRLRYVRINNFWATNRYETGFPSSEVSTGYLWYLTRDELSIGGRIGDLMVSEVNPAELASVYFFADVRKATLDLGALSLKIGFRLKLF